MAQAKRIVFLWEYFRIPTIVFIGISIYLLLEYILKLQVGAVVLAMAIVALGSFDLFKETYQSILKKQFGLDYLAILAIVVALITREYLVAAVIALMLSSGRTLEAYGVSQAQKSLTNLVDRIPSEITLWQNHAAGESIPVNQAQIGQEILVRKGEVVAVDGVLLSISGMFDESSLTGEPNIIEKVEGDAVRSGTINLGEALVIKVTREEKDSTYHRIVEMVRQAQEEKAPLVRLADRYSIWFTAISLAIAAFAFFSLHGLYGVLAVLVLATPCPLILATPIALMGGVNASAKKRIIVKKLASLEVLSRINTVVFDKTGTLTIGRPELTMVEIKDKTYSKQQILSIAQAIERNSLHPLAKAIVAYAKEYKAPVARALNVTETVGYGISATVNQKSYSLSKLREDVGMAIKLVESDNEIAVFFFEDKVKDEARTIVKYLKNLGLSLYIFTGDRLDAAKKVVDQLTNYVTVRASLTPEEKQAGVKELQEKGKVIAMIGDGINDAPALALADVGMVFSNEEQTAASEAADIVFLGNEFSLVFESLGIAKRTIHIALQSILWGIGMSITFMVLAAFGLIPPLIGAIIQEAIDVIVIINALRTSR